MSVSEKLLPFLVEMEPALVGFEMVEAPDAVAMMVRPLEGEHPAEAMLALADDDDALRGLFALGVVAHGTAADVNVDPPATWRIRTIVVVTAVDAAARTLPLVPSPEFPHEISAVQVPEGDMVDMSRMILGLAQIV